MDQHEILMRSYKRTPITFVRGEGVFLTDSSGKSYLDCLSGIAVVSAGHANPLVADAVARQAHTLVHVSNLFSNEPMLALAKRLQASVGWGRIFFCNSGAEANECAIKIARKAGQGRYKVLCAEGGFHGRTLATLAATGQPEKWRGFEPLPEGFMHAPFNDLEAFARKLDDRTAAILVEPVQGERGVIPAISSFLLGLRDLATHAGIPLIFDEIQTGMARSGSWWAFQRLGVEPDILTSAKALANGLPIGACVAKEPYGSTFQPGDHGTTFGGGAVVCAAALATFTVLEAVLPNIPAREAQFRAALTRVFHVAEVRGVGLMLGVVLTKPIAAQVVELALREGLIVNAPAADVIRLTPPLVITPAEVDEAVQRLARAILQAGG